MEKTTTYFENGDEFCTYKFMFGNDVKILVKKNKKPFKLIRFDKINGIIKHPQHI